ncbi:MAG: ATP synthase subunit I, partial [Rickettsiella sp.]|nr:ATP synthase subunit I [Rickettsiella sp.]
SAYYTVRQFRGISMVVSKTQCPLDMVRQIGGASLIAAASALFMGGIFHAWQIVCSLLLGIFLWMLPSCYFANKLFRHLGKISPTSLLRIFYRAEITKLLLSGIFFVMMIKLLSVNIPVLIAGYFVPQLIFWARLIMKNKEALI